jgi:hypothetical protein
MMWGREKQSGSSGAGGLAQSPPPSGPLGPCSKPGGSTGWEPREESHQRHQLLGFSDVVGLNLTQALP